MEQRERSITPGELEERITALLANEQIPYPVRQAMARAAVVGYDDGGATRGMIRKNWQSTCVVSGVILHVMDDGRVFLEITDEKGCYRSFSRLSHDTLGHSLAHEDWLPLDQL